MSSFSAGDTLCRAGASLSQCLFVESGVVGVLAEGDPCGVEVGTVSANGMLGLAAAFGESVSSHTAVARTAVEALSVNPAILMGLARDCPAFQKALLRFAHGRMEESMQLCSCNARHTIEQRLARWVLTACGAGGEEVHVTHDDLASALGVRRASITVCLHGLEGKLALRSQRGRIVIRDRSALERFSCGCQRRSASDEKVPASGTGLRGRMQVNERPGRALDHVLLASAAGDLVGAGPGLAAGRRVPLRGRV